MTSRRFRITAAVLATMLAGPGVASAVTVAQKCAQGKNKEAGKYAYCRQKVEAKFATTGDAAARTAGLTKCFDKYALKWPVLETKAVSAGGACPSVGDQGTVQTMVDAHTSDLATLLSGGSVANCAADLAACLAEPHSTAMQTGQTGCWDSAGTAIACAGTLQDGALQAGVARGYTDNGNGTVTDVETGLTWEKLSDDGSIHDKDTTYTWADAFAVKIAMLNATSFAGHDDWRVPNVNEIKSLVDYGAVSPAVTAPLDQACAPGCTVLTCSCTQSDAYWTSTSFQAAPLAAWIHEFNSGFLGVLGKTDPAHVRAVRGGL
jgi:hypothetical protein